MKYWKILAGKVKETKEIIHSLLKNRSLNSDEEIEDFFDPPDPSSLNPLTLGLEQKEMSRAESRIKKAIDKKERTVVYGDYDADGICGTAILWETLHNLGADVLPYIPHRVHEGYGLSKKSIDNLLAKPYCLLPRASLIITVDHGITAYEEVGYAKSKGFDVIVTDHHQKPQKLPQTLATIWTDQISGAAVAWILAKELNHSSPNSELIIHNHLGLVALATIADLLPLKGPNRSFVKFGLGQLNKTQRPGLLSLVETAGITLGKIGIYETSFILAPRLNASGRIEHALDSLRLLCTRDPKRGASLAQKLNQINLERQRLTEEAFLHARSLVEETSRLIFISHPSYNEGVIGLVAGKLTEEFCRPAVVVAEGKTHSKASARSVNGFNIIEFIRKFEELLVDCGGHPMAAGFTIETTRLKEVKNRLLELAQKEITQEQLEKILKVDCEVEFADINWALYEELSKFGPFGVGNPEPVFLTRQVKIGDTRTVGADGKHLKLLIENNSSKFSAIGFGLGDWEKKLRIGDYVDLVYTLLVDSWSGQERLQLKIKDLKPSP